MHHDPAFAAVNALTVVMDFGGLAVHGDDVPLHGHAVQVADGLVAQADAQHGDAPAEVLDHGGGAAGLFGSAGAGGDDEVCWAAATVEPRCFIGGDLVVADDVDFDGRIDLAQPLDKVVREGVVVVDQEDHRGKG